MEYKISLINLKNMKLHVTGFFFRKNRLLKIIRVIRKSKISRNEKQTTEI